MMRALFSLLHYVACVLKITSCSYLLFSLCVFIFMSMCYRCVDSRTVTLKGRVACEMNTCDELLATEILFFNVLEPLNPPEVASFLSALVFQVRVSLHYTLLPNYIIFVHKWIL